MPISLEQSRVSHKSPDQFGKQLQEHVSVLKSAPFLQFNIGQALKKLGKFSKGKLSK
jgi:hypothetical protein